MALNGTRKSIQVRGGFLLLLRGLIGLAYSVDERDIHAVSLPRASCAAESSAVVALDVNHCCALKRQLTLM